MATQEERRQATRSALLHAARPQFVEFGFEGALTEKILRAAGVSRGAMYHHFPTKTALFEAVFEEVSREAIRRAGKAAEPQGSPLRRLTRACLAWLEEAKRPEVSKILIEEGPKALGWKRARDLESRSSLGLMIRSLELAAEAGEIQVPSLPMAARLLNAALSEAALTALYEPEVSPAEIEASIERLIAGLTGPSPRP